MADERFITLTEEEIHGIDKVYSLFLEEAKENLLFKEGRVLGPRVIESRPPKSGFFAVVEKRLAEMGWCRAASVGPDEVAAEGSIEAGARAGKPSCHRLRGIISYLMEEYYEEIVEVTEISCVSAGAGKCVFKVERMGRE